jgi:hypothetical protein
VTLWGIENLIYLVVSLADALPIGVTQLVFVGSVAPDSVSL